MLMTAVASKSGARAAQGMTLEHAKVIATLKLSVGFEIVTFEATTFPVLGSVETLKKAVGG